MNNIHVNALGRIPVSDQPLEIVERKGLGHPDTICDSVMNTISVALSKEYVKRFGAVLHHNLDKSLLGAGVTAPRFGGGSVSKPMRFIFGDRATFKVPGYDPVDVFGIAEDTAKRWFKENLRFVDPETIVFDSAINQGSGNLMDIFSRKTQRYLGSNDTSATVGYAPHTPTESLVLALEKHLQSPSFHGEFPSAGEDVKVMALREGGNLDLTIAMAMVDRFIDSEQRYFSLKKEITREVGGFFSRYQEQNRVPFLNIAYKLDALDSPGRGEDGCYLTVTGTSAESGDSGQVGRGNDPAGIIPLNRPMASEAAAGKNPVSHVGKIYNLLSFRLANRIYNDVSGCREVYTWLLSEIGRPINEPKTVSVQIVPVSGIDKHMLASAEEVVADEFEHLDEFCRSLFEGVAASVC